MKIKFSNCSYCGAEQKDLSLKETNGSVVCSKCEKQFIAEAYKLKIQIEKEETAENPPLFLLLNDNTKRVLNYEIVYVAVYLKIDKDGFMKPVAIEWTDGKLFKIDKITDERNAPPEHTGGVLTRKYRVIIKGREKILYLDKQTNRWFVERLAGQS